jgi:predicted ATPase
MKRYILTGTPGAGKTAVLRQLEREGFAVVEEAATDVIALEQAKGIAQPWTIPSFIEQIVDLQRRRLERHATAEGIQFHDRSAVCTAALADWLGYPRPATLVSELERFERESVFQRRVFFIRSLGFIKPTEARRISYENAQRFEQVHEKVYRERGFEIVPIDPASVLDRVAAIRRAVWSGVDPLPISGSGSRVEGVRK